jgi:NAD(P)-dependent dehydrogenase (short-subunit alcohol dehydrogenase family)
MKPAKDIFDVKGRVIIITGGTGVLGTHYAHVLSSLGANVCIGDLDEKKCESLAKELQHDYKTNPIGLCLDLTKKESVMTFVDVVIDKYDQIDVLINNAATKSPNFFSPLETFPLEDWKHVMDVNITGMFLMAQAVIPQMVKRKSGSIINISSIHGIVGPHKDIYEGTPIISPAVYSVSKGGVVQLTKWLATMYGDQNIRTNTLTLGGVAEHQLGGNDFQKKYMKHVPLGRMTVKDDITGPLLLLASDASSGMTGHDLVVDGGWTVW